jgi:hypothetical protein
MSRVRASRLIWLSGISILLAASICCSTFGSGDSPATEDAGGDGQVAPLADGAADGTADLDAGLDAPTTLRAACPPPSGGDAAPQSWTSVPLFTPPGPARMYPWDIATDSTHITWVAQMGAADGGPDVDPYNGHGTAVVLRVPKAGGATTTLARDQPKATAIALDGDQVYWATFESTTNAASLVRQQRDVSCTASACPAPSNLLSFPAGPLIVRLRRVAPGVLFALADNGALFRVTVAGSTVALATTTGQYPSMTATSADVYASAATVNHVTRLPLSGPSMAALPDVTLPTLPPDLGPMLIASDCAALWWVRKSGASTWSASSHPHGDAGAFSTAVPLPGLFPYDLAADARFVYVTSANTGGVYAIDKAAQGAGPIQLYQGNVFKLAVDDEGVYFGEHGQVAGAGTMRMLVKK